MKVVVIDDEQNCRIVLRDKLVRLDPTLKVIGEASGVQSGIALIREKRPDLVFLDIQMNDGTGFDLLNMVKDVSFNLIFTTAFDQYAIKAFKFSATDYLLKPIDKKELLESIERIKSKNQKPNHNNGLLSIYESGDFDSIRLRSEDDIKDVQLTDILYIKADGSYCVFHLSTKDKIVVSKPLKEYADLLLETFFMRTHKSFLVNLHSVQSFHYKSLKLILLSGEEVSVSRRNKKEVLDQVVKTKRIKLLKNN